MNPESKANQQADAMIDKLRQEMGIKPVGATKESGENKKIKEACEVFNECLGTWTGVNLDVSNMERYFEGRERAKLSGNIGLQLSHVVEGAYPLGREKINEIIPALETLGFTPDEIPEMDLCSNLFLRHKNSDEAWAEYRKRKWGK